MTALTEEARLDPAQLADDIAARVEAGAQLAGLFASPGPEGTTVLRAVLAEDHALAVVATELGPGTTSFPSVTPRVAAAGWYEREIHDLYGLDPEGHPYDDPLLLPRPEGVAPPRPGPGQSLESIQPDTAALPRLLGGEGVFTIPYGPVRSGVFETVEYLVETPGEDIAYLRTRVYHKHRGVETRFTGLGVDEGVLLAERVEGVAGVAHAVAFCQAVESLAGVEVPEPAELIRVVHAELERVVNHLDSIIRHAEGAAQAVAFARLSYQKERLMRLRAQLCGHRFGRAVVIPGGTAPPTGITSLEASEAAKAISSSLGSDLKLLMGTPSFIDRLRDTGPVSADVARRFGALGPVGRGSGTGRDVRRQRPYGAYRSLELGEAAYFDGGDALARQLVRLAEIQESFGLIDQALAGLGSRRGAGWPRTGWAAPLPPVSGLAIGSAEAPQGEVLYLVEAVNGRLERVKPRSASFHNLAFFRHAFGGDIFTDFVFIEASFGLSMAGVSI
ncbi:MAG: hydrogenase large subunit [Acidimicrobiales bacterium]